MKERTNISTCLLLRKLLASIASKHCTKKSATFKKETVQKALKEKHDEEDLKDLTGEIAASLLCCRLHRRSELLKITAENARIDKTNSISIQCLCSAKC